MTALPLPIVTFILAVVAAALIARRSFGVGLARNLFVGFFAVMACGSLLVGVRFGYGIDTFVPVQRVLPLFGGPLLYLGFAVLTLPPGRAVRRIAVHLGIALIVAIGLHFLAAQFIGTDVILAASSLIYGLLIFGLWLAGPNHLSRARLEAVRGLRLGMLVGAGFLVLTALLDSAIALSFALSGEGAAVRLISIASTCLAVGMAALIYALGRGKPVPTELPRVRDTGAEADIRAMLVETQIYLDTELTVERLAKRMRLPVRQVSAAINDETGLNVSQYVNQFRLEHAAALLVGTKDSVATVMEASGFLTRSNFYREFQRVYGQSPAAYRAERTSGQ